MKSICHVLDVGGQVDGRRGAASDQSEQPLSDCGRTRGFAPCGTIDYVGLTNEYLDVFGGLLMDF